MNTKISGSHFASECDKGSYNSLARSYIIDNSLIFWRAASDYFKLFKACYLGHTLLTAKLLQSHRAISWTYYTQDTCQHELESQNINCSIRMPYVIVIAINCLESMDTFFSTEQLYWWMNKRRSGIIVGVYCQLIITVFQRTMEVVYDFTCGLLPFAKDQFYHKL